VVAGLATVSLGGYSGAILYTGNFHAVSEHALYRSAQLTKEQFAAVIRRNRIKSILNLRGAHPGEPWYDDEIAVSRRAGVKHYDYPISATRRVSEREIAAIVEILRDAPKPLLIHCRSGADRTGLVAALYRFAIERAGPDESDRQLSLAYGHFPYLMSRTGAMDESFWAYVGHP
jgi:protein tyrosine/serine phosphatase